MIDRARTLARFGLAATAVLAAGLRAQQVSVETVDGAQHEGVLLPGDGTAVRLRHAGGEQSLPTETVFRLELRPVSTPILAPQPNLWLRSGQRFTARLEAAAARPGIARFALHLGTADQPTTSIELPWRYVRAFVFAEDEADPRLLARVADEPAETDTLFLNAPDEIRRATYPVLGFDADRLRAEVGGSERTLPLERLHGVVFGSGSGASPDTLPNPRVRLLARSGAQVEGKLVAWQDAAVHIRMDEGADLIVPRDQLQSVRVLSDRLLSLADLEPKVEQTPAFDRTWPVWRNANSRGDSIRVGGRRFGQGFVVVPRTRLTFELPRVFDRFEATLGMEDLASDQAHATFRVFGDGKLLYESDPVTASTPPVPLQLSIDGVRQLTLEADFGENFAFGDLCVFAAPRVVKT